MTTLWTADTVMYDGVSMDRAYSGDTLIWCKSCPKVLCGYEMVHQGETLRAGEDYIIGYRSVSDGDGYLTTGMTMRYVSGLYDDALILHCDKDYPAVYESLCEGYVTDLGAAFGIAMGNTGNRHHDYTLVINPNNKRSLSTYIGYDWMASHNPDRDVIMKQQLDRSWR